MEIMLWWINININININIGIYLSAMVYDENFFDILENHYVPSREEGNLLAVCKDSELYVFFYDDEVESMECLLETFDRYALDARLNFDENDASHLGKKVIELRKKLENNLIFGDRLEQMF